MTCVNAQEDGRPRIALELEVDLTAQPIEGTMSHAGGRPKPFVGWLGLTAALDKLLSRQEARAPEKLG